MKRSAPSTKDNNLEALWAHHHAQFRDPSSVVVQWPAAAPVDPATFACRVTGEWWDVLDELGITLIVTREYEHLVQAFCVREGRRRVSYLQLPHPNGLAVDPDTGRLHIASTRNPNVVFDMAPCTGAVQGREGDDARGELLPAQARYLPGCLYIHDIAMIGGKLHANAVGLNAVVQIHDEGRFEPVWWPSCIDSPNGPRWDRNYLQLNSIAAGSTLADSYFGASAAIPSARRPGHKNFPVDRRGVVFSGRTRDVCGTGLTRPHSARFHGRELWIDNSGYGEVGRIIDGHFEPFAKLPGWTRGLLFQGKFLLVGSSQVLARYRHYAPGLDPDTCQTGIHILELTSGRVVGSMIWPAGNQIFAIEALPRTTTTGFPFEIKSSAKASKRLVRAFGASIAA